MRNENPRAPGGLNSIKLLLQQVISIITTLLFEDEYQTSTYRRSHIQDQHLHYFLGMCVHCDVMYGFLEVLNDHFLPLTFRKESENNRILFVCATATETM